jgi:hypothetical protein
VFHLHTKEDEYQTNTNSLFSLIFFAFFFELMRVHFLDLMALQAIQNVLEDM